MNQQQSIQAQLAKQTTTNHSPHQDVTTLDPFIQQVIANIERNMSDEHYSIQNMAKEMNLSRAQFFRKVKHIVGTSPSRLLNQYRLEKAKALLTQSDQSVAEVAFAVGFSDPNYFSRVYKKYYNVSPNKDR